MHHFAALRTSLPVALHREFETIDARSAHWARTYLPFPDDAARRRFTAEGHTRWTCLLFPTGASERVLAIANLTLLLFATDDALVAGSAGARRLLDAARAVLDDRPAGGDPWEPGLRAAWQPLRRAMGAAQRRRLATAILLLFRGAEEERRLRLRQQLPGYAEYLRLRRDRSVPRSTSC